VFIYVPLCWVRKIETLAPTHVFADLMIFITVVSILTYAFIKIDKDGFQPVPALNENTFIDAIGSMVYSYEGVGVIIPVYEVAAKPENVKRILGYVLTSVLALYIAFGFLCLFTYGKELELDNIITETVSRDEGLAKIDGFLIAIKIAFSFNLIFSYPLVIYPANIILEDNIYKGWPKSKKRQWFKNLNRALMVIFTVIVSILMAEQLDKFLALLGALACAPIAFTLPTLMHLKLCNPSPRMILWDKIVIGISLFILVFCSGYSTYSWINAKSK
jgi:proton-coupled amino acid transporter